MKKETKEKHIVARFDQSSYDKINELAKLEHRGLGDLVRHAVLVYIEMREREREALVIQDSRPIALSGLRQTGAGE